MDAETLLSSSEASATDFLEDNDVATESSSWGRGRIPDQLESVLKTAGLNPLYVSVDYQRGLEVQVASEGSLDNDSDLKQDVQQTELGQQSDKVFIDEQDQFGGQVIVLFRFN
jgi:hypothetical protein